MGDRRPGGYVAREESTPAPTTKEQKVVAAVKSPLARRDIDVSSTISYKIVAENKAAVDISLLIDPTKLGFTETLDGKHQVSFDVVGFVYDQLGKLRGGFSETVNTNLTPVDYARALEQGLSYDAHTELPSGYFQLRVAVRDAGTGGLGTLSRYLEIPDLSKHRLAMSSLFMYEVDPNVNRNDTDIETLSAARRLSRRELPNPIESVA